jgi:AraC-like DNA-binding protein
VSVCTPRDYLVQRLALLQASPGGGVDPLTDEERILRQVAGIARRAAGARPFERERELRARTPDMVTRARLVLGRRFHDDASLAEVGHEIATSAFHLSRTFKTVTGLTVHRYLTELRLRASLEQIATPSSNLASIAVDLGFASHSHFSSAFRASFGMTPSEFRRLAGTPTRLGGEARPGGRAPHRSLASRRLADLGPQLSGWPA